MTALTDVNLSRLVTLYALHGGVREHQWFGHEIEMFASFCRLEKSGLVKLGDPETDEPAIMITPAGSNLAKEAIDAMRRELCQDE